MAKITVGNKEFTPPPSNPPPEEPPTPTLRKLTKKEVLILIGVVSSLLFLGWMPTQLVYKAKITKLEQKIVQLDPLNKIELDLNHKLDKLEQDLKVEDDDLYKILSKLRSDRKLQILDQLDQIQLFKSRQNVYLFDYLNSKTQELKQKELLYHR
jgi:Tfp pilus assembly protein PilN